jgi:hypothetical protein
MASREAAELAEEWKGSSLLSVNHCRCCQRNDWTREIHWMTARCPWTNGGGCGCCREMSVAVEEAVVNSDSDAVIVADVDGGGSGTTGDRSIQSSTTMSSTSIWILTCCSTTQSRTLFRSPTGNLGGKILAPPIAPNGPGWSCPRLAGLLGQSKSSLALWGDAAGRNAVADIVVDVCLDIKLFSIARPVVLVLSSRLQVVQSILK